MEPTDERCAPRYGRALPYNTGKVLIGSRYEPPPQNNLLSKSAYDLQTALLSPPVRGPGFLARFLSRLMHGGRHD